MQINPNNIVANSIHLQSYPLPLAEATSPENSPTRKITQVHISRPIEFSDIDPAGLSPHFFGLYTLLGKMEVTRKENEALKPLNASEGLTELKLIFEDLKANTVTASTLENCRVYIPKFPKTFTKPFNKLTEHALAKFEIVSDILCLAVEKGHLQLVELLIDRVQNWYVLEARFNAHNNPLFIASEQGHTDIVQLLLQTIYATDIDTKDSCFESSLRMATAGGHVAIVELLLDRGVSMDTENWIYEYPYFVAIAHGYVPIVELFLDRGFYMYARTHNGWDALEVAKRNNRPLVVELLLSRGFVTE